MVLPPQHWQNHATVIQANSLSYHNFETTSVTSTHQTFLWGQDSQISLSEQLSTLNCHAYGCKNVPWLIWIWVGLTPYSCWFWDFWLYLIWQRTAQEAERLNHCSEVSDIFVPGLWRTQTQLEPEVSKLLNLHKQASKLRLQFCFQLSCPKCKLSLPSLPPLAGYLYSPWDASSSACLAMCWAGSESSRTKRRGKKIDRNQNALAFGHICSLTWLTC